MTEGGRTRCGGIVHAAQAVATAGFQQRTDSLDSRIRASGAHTVATGAVQVRNGGIGERLVRWGAAGDNAGFSGPLVDKRL